MAAAVRVFHKHRSTVIQVNVGDKMSTIKGIALRFFDLRGREGRLSVRATGVELLDDELIEAVPGLSADILRKASERRPPPPVEPPAPPQQQLLSLDETQYEVLRDSSALGPAFTGDPNSPAGVAYRLQRHLKFQALLRSDFRGNVDRAKLEERIERILNQVEAAMNNPQAGTAVQQQQQQQQQQPAKPRSQENSEAKRAIVYPQLTVVMELLLQAPCFHASFRPLLSPDEVAEGEERPEVGRMLVCYDECLRDIHGLVGRVLSAPPKQLVIRPLKLTEPFPCNEDKLPTRDDTFLVQRLGRGSIMLQIEKEEPVRFDVNFAWSLGEVQWAIRRLAPQLRRVEFSVSVGNYDLLSLGTAGLATSLGQVYLGLTPLTVKIVLDYGGRPMPPSRRTLVPELEEEEEEAVLDGPVGALEITRVADFVQFMRLQSQAFQVTRARTHQRRCLADLLREMATRAAATEDRDEHFVPPPARAVGGQGPAVFLRLPPRALFYIRVEVREEETDRCHRLPWVLPNTKLRAFQAMLADLSGCQPEDQSLSFLGRSLGTDTEASLQSLGIRKDAELSMRRSFRVTLREIGSGTTEKVRVLGRVHSLRQFRQQLQSRFGIDADLLRLTVDGRPLPLDGNLRQLGIGPDTCLEWRRPVRAAFRLGRGLRADLLLFPDAPASRLVDFANARRGEEGRAQPVTADELEVWHGRLPNPSMRAKIQHEEGSLEQNGFTDDFQVVLRPSRHRQ